MKKVQLTTIDAMNKQAGLDTGLLEVITEHVSALKKATRQLREARNYKAFENTYAAEATETASFQATLKGEMN